MNQSALMRGMGYLMRMMIGAALGAALGFCLLFFACLYLGLRAMSNRPPDSLEFWVALAGCIMVGGGGIAGAWLMVKTKAFVRIPRSEEYL